MSTKRIRVIVRYRKGVLDPQGKTIRNVLKTMGYQSVANVHAGKVFEIEWQGERTPEAEQTVREIAEKILSNPIIEEFEIQWLDGPSV